MTFKISLGKNGTDVTGTGPLFEAWKARHNVGQTTITTRPIDRTDVEGMPVEQDEHFEALARIEASRRQANVNRVEKNSQAETEAKWIDKYTNAPAGSVFHRQSERKLREAGYNL